MVRLHHTSLIKTVAYKILEALLHVHWLHFSCFLTFYWDCAWIFMHTLLSIYNFAVRLAPKLTETVKGKLSLGKRILQVGGVEKVFKQLFSVTDCEKLLKASQCYLSTTSGPIAGLLFISTGKVAFCSERSIKIFSPTGKQIRIYYKVNVLVFLCVSQICVRWSSLKSLRRFLNVLCRFQSHWER